MRACVCGIVIGQTMQPEPTLVSSGCRFCKVCGITSTTQWRRGPDGYISYVVGTAAALICWRETQPVVAQEDMPNQANNDPRTQALQRVWPPLSQDRAARAQLPLSRAAVDVGRLAARGLSAKLARSRDRPMIEAVSSKKAIGWRWRCSHVDAAAAAALFLFFLRDFSRSVSSVRPAALPPPAR